MTFTKKSSQPNPSVFMVTDAKDPRLYKPELIKNGLYEILKQMLTDGPLYGTYLRSDYSFWEDEVFVCPNCIHATLLDEGDEITTEYFCKYCHTDWVIKDGRIMMKWTKYDNDDNELETVLI